MLNLFVQGFKPGTQPIKWDAAIYNTRTGALYCSDNYFSNIRNLTLEINLPIIHNPLGSFVRSLRFLSIEEVKTGPGLSKFLLEKFAEFEDTEIFKYERNSFSSHRLSCPLLTSFRQRSLQWDGDDIFLWKQPDKMELF